MLKIKKLRGLTLVEILIALAVNSILLIALVAAFSSYVGTFNKSSKMNTLNQQLKMAMDIMSTDIRRAGFWANAKNDALTSQNNNPFMAAGTDLTISGNCILFTYDRAKTGALLALNTANDDDRYGYRLNGNVLESRPSTAAYSCATTGVAWEPITNATTVQITGLTFTLNTQAVPPGATADYVQLRTVTISLTGRLTSDNSVTRTLTETIRIRNDKYVP